MDFQDAERKALEYSLARALRQLGHLSVDGGLLAQVALRKMHNERLGACKECT